MERFEILRTLGKGTGGKVFLAAEKESGKYVLYTVLPVVGVINVNVYLLPFIGLR